MTKEVGLCKTMEASTCHKVEVGQGMFSEKQAKDTKDVWELKV